MIVKTDRDLLMKYHRDTGTRVTITESRPKGGYIIPYAFYEYLMEQAIENENRKAKSDV